MRYSFGGGTGLRGLGVALAFAPLLLAGCAQPPVQPSPTHLEAPSAQVGGAIPAPVHVAPVLPTPTAAARAETYSVVVTNVNIHDLLFALARDAKLNIDIHPGVVGSVTLNAVDQTLHQLLTRLSRLVDIRWEIQGTTLLVLPNTPYVQIYTVDYLNMSRTVNTTVSVKGGISGATSGSSGGSSGGSSSSGSTADTKIDVKSSNNFWDELIKNVRNLVVEEDRLRTISARITQSAATVNTGVTSQGTGQAAVSTSGVAAGAGNQQVQGQSNAATAAQAQTAVAELAEPVFANPNAGILMVRATSRVHEKIREYLDRLMMRSNLQVFIEATIAEVQLSNQYQQGIDWSVLRNGVAGFRFAQSVTGTSPAAVNSSIFVADYASQRFTATLRLLDSFGTVRILSSPRISVLNNQTAVLKVSDDRVFFTVQATTTASNNAPAITTFTTTPHTVAIGFTMNVTPQISDTDTVILNLKPLITRIIGFVNDPNPDLARLGVVSRIPEVQAREMESMVRINSGQIAVMGGLIQDSLSDVEDGIPGLNRVPGVGTLFTHRNRDNRKTELVIFLRPIVVRDASVDGDYRAYREFLPSSNFMGRPNPGKPLVGQPASPTQQ
jgi:general secretion pathway protein D